MSDGKPVTLEEQNRRADAIAGALGFGLTVDEICDAMGDEAAFLSAIRSNPADDTVRLVFADWLEEHGQALLAEFIRVQCELATLNPNPTLPSNREALNTLRGRERFLWTEQTPSGWAIQGSLFVGSGHHLLEVDALAASLPDDHRLPIVIYRRGFPDEVICRAVDWLTHGDVALAHPVRRVTLTTMPQLELVDLLSMPSVHRYNLTGRTKCVEVYEEELVAMARPAGAPDIRGVALRLLAMEWPGVAFTLPD